MTFLSHTRSLPSFLLVTDEARFPDPLPIIDALPHGAGVVFRHYRHSQRGEIARTVAALCHLRRLTFLVANDISLALRLRANGLHLPQWVWERELFRRPFEEFLITGAVHSPRAIARAAKLGVDALLLSPVFKTDSHPQTAALGATKASAWARQWGRGIPIYALGGVDAEGRRRLQGGDWAGTAATYWPG